MSLESLLKSLQGGDFAENSRISDSNAEKSLQAQNFINNNFQYHQNEDRINDDSTESQLRSANAQLITLGKILSNNGIQFTKLNETLKIKFLNFEVMLVSKMAHNDTKVFDFTKLGPLLENPSLNLKDFRNIQNQNTNDRRLIPSPKNSSNNVTNNLPRELSYPNFCGNTQNGLNLSNMNLKPNQIKILNQIRNIKPDFLNSLGQHDQSNLLELIEKIENSSQNLKNNNNNGFHSQNFQNNEGVTIKSEKTQFMNNKNNNNEGGVQSMNHQINLVSPSDNNINSLSASQMFNDISLPNEMNYLNSNSNQSLPQEIPEPENPEDCKCKLCTYGLVSKEPYVISSKTGDKIPVEQNISCKDQGIFMYTCKQPDCQAQLVMPAKASFASSIMTRSYYIFRLYFQKIFKNPQDDLAVKYRSTQARHYESKHPHLCNPEINLKDCYKIQFLCKKRDNENINDLFTTWTNLIQPELERGERWENHHTSKMEYTGAQNNSINKSSEFSFPEPNNNKTSAYSMLESLVKENFNKSPTSLEGLPTMAFSKPEKSDQLSDENLNPLFKSLLSSENLSSLPSLSKNNGQNMVVGQKRGRGRPPKIKTEDHLLDKEPNTPPIAKRGRGRPRKEEVNPELKSNNSNNSANSISSASKTAMMRSPSVPVDQEANNNASLHNKNITTTTANEFDLDAPDFINNSGSFIAKKTNAKITVPTDINYNDNGIFIIECKLDNNYQMVMGCRQEFKTSLRQMSILFNRYVEGQIDEKNVSMKAAVYVKKEHPEALRKGLKFTECYRTIFVEKGEEGKNLKERCDYWKAKLGLVMNGSGE